MNRGFERLKQRWNDEPMQVLVVGALVATAASKLLDAWSNAKGRRTWEREVNRRERKLR